MTQIINELLRELAELLSQLSFTDERADLREGPHWSVYAHPWPGEDEKHFDALISITPCQSEVGPHQGLRLAVQRGNTTWFANTVTNQRGQAWCKQLPLGRFNARFAGMPRQHGSQAVKEVGTELSMVSSLSAKEWEAGALAAAASSSGQDERSSAPRMFYLPDSRIVALLEEGTEGRAVLTVETNAPELAGAIVCFELEEEKGEITLIPTDPPGAWAGQRVLRQSFHAVEAALPVFELKLPAQQEEVHRP